MLLFTILGKPLLRKNPVSQVLSQNARIRLQDFLKWNISRKKLGIKLVFCIWLNVKVFHKSTILFWWAGPGMFKVPKATSFQYLSNISRKVRDKFSKVFYKLIPSFLLAITRHVQAAQDNTFPTS